MRVEGQLAFGIGDRIPGSVLASQGIAYVFEEQIADHMADDRLVHMPEPWCSMLSGYHFYRTGRRQTPAALSAFIAALRGRLRRAESPGAGKPLPPRKPTRKAAR